MTNFVKNAFADSAANLNNFVAMTVSLYMTVISFFGIDNLLYKSGSFRKIVLKKKKNITIIKAIEKPRNAITTETINFKN